MPPDQEAYWEWVRSINKGADEALAEGIQLLNEHPQLGRLYLRLAKLCLEMEARETCQEALAQLQPPDSVSALYHEAAAILLLGEDNEDEVLKRWQGVAQDPALDPTVTRLIVDKAFEGEEEASISANEEETWFDAMERRWQQQLAADSSAAGAAFGLGYAAVLRDEWEAGEKLLNHVAQLCPGEPEAYRELGRIYIVNGRSEKFELAMQAGIRGASRKFQIDQELILRGNYGWWLMTRKEDLDEAEQVFREAIQQSRDLADRETEGFNYYRLADVFIRQHRYQEAFPLLDSAEVRYAEYVSRRYFHVLSMRSRVLRNVYRYSEAEAVLEKSIAGAEAKKNIGAEVQALLALANLRLEMGRYEAARTVGLDGLKVAQETQRTTSTIAARQLLGDIERQWGNYEDALQHLEEGRVLAEQGQDVRDIREFTSALGMIFLELRDAVSAKAQFDLLLDGIDPEEESQSLTEAYLGLARAYQQFQNPEESQRYYNLSIARLREDGSPQMQAEALMDKASLLTEIGAFDEADSLYQEAETILGEDQALAYKVAVGLGNLFLAQQQYAEALKHFENAIVIEQGLAQPAIHWYVLFGQAMAYWHLEEATSAESAFRESIKQIEALRENLHASNNRSSYVQDKVQVYEHFAAVLETDGRIEEALHITERARSRNLLDLLYTTQRAHKIDTTRITDRLIEAERQVRALERDIVRSEVSSSESGSIQALQQEYERTAAAYQRIQSQLQVEQPIYTFNPLQTADIQATLTEDEALIAYDLRHIGQGSSRRNASVAYVVLADSLLLYPIDTDPDELVDVVRLFRGLLEDRDGTPNNLWERAAQKLHRDLIDPVIQELPQSVEHLHLVPEGILHYVPFAALQDEQGQFLIEHYSLSITPSASILQLTRERNPGKWASMLLVGDPDSRLPGAREEVQAIASNTASKEHQVLVGSEATKEQVVQLTQQHDILHFATHGRFVARSPWRSHLELHGGDILSVEDIGRLDLNAYLVTLSACETALSGGRVADIPNGDEWIGFNQAFLAAGASTVMASLWPIDDRVSASFMQAFYQALETQDKARALAEVQRQFIQDPDKRHPFFWAPFSIIGDPL